MAAVNDAYIDGKITAVEQAPAKQDEYDYLITVTASNTVHQVKFARYIVFCFAHTVAACSSKLRENRAK